VSDGVTRQAAHEVARELLDTVHDRLRCGGVRTPLDAQLNELRVAAAEAYLHLAREERVRASRPTDAVVDAAVRSGVISREEAALRFQAERRASGEW